MVAARVLGTALLRFGDKPSSHPLHHPFHSFAHCNQLTHRIIVSSAMYAGLHIEIWQRVIEHLKTPEPSPFNEAARSEIRQHGLAACMRVSTVSIACLTRSNNRMLVHVTA